jgi:predicted N-formylglutamate amidohydrolase
MLEPTPDPAQRRSLLAADEPPPFSLRNREGRARLVFSCDHASNRIPRRYGDFGLSAAALQDHIAWDIGAAALAARLSDAFDAPAVFSGYSRLVVDCNRRPEDAAAMPAVSDGRAIPLNDTLDPAERRARIETFFAPFHAAVAAMMARPAPGPAMALLSVHSFTPRMNGFDRPWHIGALWEGDARIAAPFMAGLRARGDVCVGDNLPYSFSNPRGYTLDTHAFEKSIPCMGIEVRQDLLADPAGVERWATILVEALRPALAALRAV